MSPQDSTIASNQTAVAAGGTFTFPCTNLTVHRIGYGAMQLP